MAEKQSLEERLKDEPPRVMPREITLEELKEESWEGKTPTVGEFLEYVKKNDIPLDAKILVERVDDFYFRKMDWGVVYLEALESWQYQEYVKSMEKRIANGDIDDPETIAEFQNEDKEKCLKESRDQYMVPSWIGMEKKGNNILIGCHI